MDRQRIIIAGGSGFIGRAIAREVTARGSEVVILTRAPEKYRGPGRAVGWDGQNVGEWVREIDGADAVINLAGKNVNCRYTPKILAEVDESRVNAVRVVGEAIGQCASPPRVLVQASTTAIYGDRHEELIDESSPIGFGVPTDTATKWESAFDASEELMPNTRRVLLRMSFVLGRGGVLQFLARLARFFMGGTVGAGRQYISWIHIDDLVRVFVRAIEDDHMSGLYIASGPTPVTNRVFMRELRRALHRPWVPPTPALMVRLGCFCMRTEPVLALTGRKVQPRRLLEGGFEFQHRELAQTLRDLLA